jgi:hypothetical protein
MPNKSAHYNMYPPLERELAFAHKDLGETRARCHELTTELIRLRRTLTLVEVESGVRDKPAAYRKRPLDSVVPTSYVATGAEGEDNPVLAALIDTRDRLQWARACVQDLETELGRVMERLEYAGGI